MQIFNSKISVQAIKDKNEVRRRKSHFPSMAPGIQPIPKTGKAIV